MVAVDSQRGITAYENKDYFNDHGYEGPHQTCHALANEKLSLVWSLLLAVVVALGGKVICHHTTSHRLMRHCCK